MDKNEIGRWPPVVYSPQPKGKMQILAKGLALILMGIALQLGQGEKCGLVAYEGRTGAQSLCRK
jgi:hypothetical protein